MNVDHRALDLHDKSTRGLALSAEEQSYLEHWYDEQDRAENADLSAAAPPDSLTTLKTKIEATLREIPVLTERINALAAANDELRQEIEVCKQKLTQLSTSQLP